VIILNDTFSVDSQEKNGCQWLPVYI